MTGSAFVTQLSRGGAEADLVVELALGAYSEAHGGAAACRGIEYCTCKRCAFQRALRRRMRAVGR